MTRSAAPKHPSLLLKADALVVDDQKTKGKMNLQRQKKCENTRHLNTCASYITGSSTVHNKRLTITWYVKHLFISLFLKCDMDKMRKEDRTLFQTIKSVI